MGEHPGRVQTSCEPVGHALAPGAGARQVGRVQVVAGQAHEGERSRQLHVQDVPPPGDVAKDRAGPGLTEQSEGGLARHGLGEPVTVTELHGQVDVLRPAADQAFERGELRGSEIVGQEQPAGPEPRPELPHGAQEALHLRVDADQTLLVADHSRQLGTEGEVRRDLLRPAPDQRGIDPVPGRVEFDGGQGATVGLQRARGGRPRRVERADVAAIAPHGSADPEVVRRCARLQGREGADGALGIGPEREVDPVDGNAASEVHLSRASTGRGSAAPGRGCG